MKQAYVGGDVSCAPVRLGRCSTPGCRSRTSPSEQGTGRDPVDRRVHTPADGARARRQPDLPALCRPRRGDRHAPLARLRADAADSTRSTYHNYADRDDTYSFDRLDAEVVQHIPILRETWVCRSTGCCRRRSTTTTGAVLPAAVARQRQHAARLQQLAVPRSAQPADVRRVPLDSEPLGTRHGALLRRRQGHAALQRPQLQGPGERRRRRRPVPRPARDAAAHRTGARAAKACTGLLRQRGILTPHRGNVHDTHHLDARWLGSLVAVAGRRARVAVGQRPKFYDDDPLAREPETQNASEVAGWDIDLHLRPRREPVRAARRSGAGRRARATSTRSTRCPTRAGSPTASSRARCRSRRRCAGPRSAPAPAPGTWTVVAAQEAGFAPGFTMRDARATSGSSRSTPKGFPEAATGAILVANKIFWALGYWQVENHLVSVRLDQLADRRDRRSAAAVRQGAADAARATSTTCCGARTGARTAPTAPSRRAPCPAGARRLPLLRHAARRSRTTSCRTSIGASCAR